MFYPSENLLCDLIPRPSPAACERAFQPFAATPASGCGVCDLRLELSDLVPDAPINAVHFSLRQFLDKRAKADVAQRGNLLELGFQLGAHRNRELGAGAVLWSHMPIIKRKW